MDRPEQAGCCPPPTLATSSTTPEAVGCCATPPGEESAALDDAAQQELASLARALGHPARVKILSLLIQRQGCICKEIGDELPLAGSTISQHLKQLREAGLIRGEVDGPRICYCAEPAAVARLKALVASL